MSKTATIKRVWEIFGELNKVPRPSHHEGKAANYLCKFAEENGLEYERDAHNCVVLRKAATPGCEHWEPLVLLNHMDMVCVHESDYTFNPLEDAIETEIKDGWMHAKGTSLGADNGVGLSIALSIIGDDSLKHGPLEVLTTTNEEDGMSGAANLSTNFIKGRKVINLDSEDYDTITVGAAGAYMQRARWQAGLAPADKSKSHLKISIEGGKGGHSGVDINKGRGNAIKLVADLLGWLKGRHTDLQIGALNGGGSAAAIAGKASVVIAAKELDLASISKLGEEVLAPYKETDERLRLNIEKADAHPLLSNNDSNRIITTLTTLPNGVIEMREDMPGTVQTSNNIGVLQQTENQIELTTHTRSFSDETMVKLGIQIADLLQKNGAEVTLEANSPAWQENSESDFLKRVSETFEQELGFTPQKVAMHFVLEAGYFVRKYPGIEIACIGPRIISPHSTNERVEMSTVEDILKVTKRLVTTPL